LYETLPSVYFSRNSTILQANQSAVLDEVAKRLLSADRIGSPLLIEVVDPGEGSITFTEYLCERRNEEVVRLLTERGVKAETFLIGKVKATSSVDQGEVRLRVEILPPPSLPSDVPPDDSKNSGSPPTEVDP
jgi:hypothetical protein